MKKRFNKFYPLCIFLTVVEYLLLASHSFAKDIPLDQRTKEKQRVCLVLDKGGKDDHSFNQSAYAGFTKAIKDFSLDPKSKYVTVHEDAQSAHFLRSFSEGGCSLVIAVGFNNAETVGKIAPLFPQQKYIVVDSSLKAPNVKAISFKEHEGGYLMGVIAAQKSKNGKIGFIGGMEIPLIKRFATGFEAGAKSINPNINVTSVYVGVTATAWNNPTKAKELALNLYKLGTDVIFVAAGASSQGVFDATREITSSSSQATKPSYVIGTDSNQNYIVPGLVLTSMEKKVDIAVYNAIAEVTKQSFTPGVFTYGFSDGGIDWSYDEFNKKLFTQADISKINEVKDNIIKGKIEVPDYYKIKK